MKQKLFFLKALIVLTICIVSQNLEAQKQTNFNKEIKPLLKENKFEQALPLLIKFYNERLTEDGLWSDKAIFLEMEHMYLASEKIALIYYEKAIKEISAEYADSSIIWLDVMKKDNHPNKNLIEKYYVELKNIKSKASKLKIKQQEEEKIENEKKELMKIVDELVYLNFIEECIDFERIYYETKIYNSSKANEMYIVLEKQLEELGVHFSPVDTSLNNVPSIAESISALQDRLNNYFTEKRKILNFYDISLQMQESYIRSIRYTSKLDNKAHFYQHQILVSDSTLKYSLYTNIIVELNKSNRMILSSLLVTAIAEENKAREKKERDAQLAKNAENEKIMLNDKTLPNASTKLCDYRNGAFVAYVENNQVYERTYKSVAGDWKPRGVKILQRGNKKIFFYWEAWREAVIEEDGTVRVYMVAESTGERISDKSFTRGFINNNRYDPDAKSIESASDGYLFKGNKIEAIIIVLICNNFK